MRRRPRFARDSSSFTRASNASGSGRWASGFGIRRARSRVMMRHARLRVPLPRLLELVGGGAWYQRNRKLGDCTFQQKRHWVPALLALRARPSGQLRCSLASLAVAGTTGVLCGDELSAVEREVQREHIDARLAEHAELTSFGRGGDELAHRLDRHRAQTRDAGDL